ncbi:MAG TPA: endonuclease domain-containing protein [Phenylobacterium sp.]|jgi:very-short-patch-repair endonuclease|uniref:endonuclease domain-containing protein n=1 Tax=Phenylobacterium sp. TaxID=1871053 RepID=UPI002D38A327|nr:endonuclease domain-containing protein [Phenylobacterium sp.]HZZ66724.1 endonuclease domain-containing protein [Phenylobacterium sp.]
MRQTMSEAEVKLWARLKFLRERGFHIRRQAPFRGYYLDFVCLSRRLVIEVDGGQHSEEAQAAHDELRDRVLRSQGFRVMRFWTSQVHQEIDDVMDVIVLALEAQAPPVPRSARSTLPTRGREN